MGRPVPPQHKEQDYHQDAPPFVVRTYPLSVSHYDKYHHYTKWLTLLQFVEHSNGKYTHFQDERHIVLTVRTVQKIPWYLADKGKVQQLDKVLNPVLTASVAFGYEECKYRKAMHPKQRMAS